MKIITKILDSATDELSEAIKIIWKNKTRLETDAELRDIKERLDHAQTLLLNLMCDLKGLQKQLALEFYYIEKSGDF